MLLRCFFRIEARPAANLRRVLTLIVSRWEEAPFKETVAVIPPSLDFGTPPKMIYGSYNHRLVSLQLFIRWKVLRHWAG